MDREFNLRLKLQIMTGVICHVFCLLNSRFNSTNTASFERTTLENLRASAVLSFQKDMRNKIDPAGSAAQGYIERAFGMFRIVCAYAD
jgi:hypothetical protein